MMKKLLVFALTALLVLSFGISTMAGTAYVDILAGGTFEGSDVISSDESDLSGMVFGFNHYTEKVKFAGEYFNGAFQYDEDDEEYDISNIDLRCGFEIFEDSYLTIGMINGDIGYASYDGLLIGLDASFNLTDALVFEGSAGFSFSGEFTANDGTSIDATVTCYKVRLIYIIGEHLAATLGYRNNIVALDTFSEIEYSSSGATLGLSFRY